MADITYDRLLDGWFLLNDMGQSDLTNTSDALDLRKARTVVHRHMDILFKKEKTVNPGEENDGQKTNQSSE